MKIFYSFSLFCSMLIMYGCIGGGTHGAIKRYDFPVSKHSLEKSVVNVINTDQNIKRDTTKDYYNDGENYFTIVIKKGDISNTYTFGFYGDKEYWDTAKTSQLVIAYARDKEGNGGSEGDGGVTWYKPTLRNKLVSLFETEFISKLDKELGVNHTESN